MPVRVADEWRSRRSEAVETTVYFCCLECLQNAAKHAGRGAYATVLLFEDDGHADFSVEDDGAGYDPGAVERGTCLTNLADRVAAVGGTLTIDSARERGTRVTARIPPRNYAAVARTRSRAASRPRVAGDEFRSPTDADSYAASPGAQQADAGDHVACARDTPNIRCRVGIAGG